MICIEDAEYSSRGERLTLGLTFSPMFLKWPIPALNLDMSTVTNGGTSQKPIKRMANSVDPSKMPRDEPSHVDLRCLQMYLFWSVGLKG